MKIAVNTRLLIKNKLEGIGWFTYESLKRITQQHPEHEFIFIFDRPFSDEFIFANNITPVVISPQARHPFLFYAWFEYSIPYILKKHKAELFLSTDGFSSLSAKIPVVDVIHDINFAHYPQDLPWLITKYYNYFFPKFAHKATRIATVSEYSKSDIARTWGVNKDKIDVVYNGSNSFYKPLTPEEIKNTKNKYTQGKDFFIFVGALHPRKNVSRLLQAFDEFKAKNNSNIKLVIVGNQMFKTSEMEQVFSSIKHKEDVVFTGRLSPADLSLVMGSALALTFVPYFEGFGIPIVEAMNCDVPVITANVTSMPEISGNAALHVDPFSITSISNGMLAVASDEKLRNTLIAEARIQRQKFSWDKTADKLWDCIEKAGLPLTKRMAYQI